MLLNRFHVTDKTVLKGLVIQQSNRESGHGLPRLAEISSGVTIVLKYFLIFNFSSNGNVLALSFEVEIERT